MATESAERGGTTSVQARWTGGWRCEVTAGEFPLVADEPESVGGTGTGPVPTQLFLASLSSCYAMALAWAARKRGVELDDLEVDATGTYQGPKFSLLELTVRSSLDPERLRPLLEPARRACYVSNTLAHAPEVTVTLA